MAHDDLNTFTGTIERPPLYQMRTLDQSDTRFSTDELGLVNDNFGYQTSVTGRSRVHVLPYLNPFHLRLWSIQEKYSKATIEN